MLFGYHSDKIKEILKSVYGEKFSYVPFVDNEDRRIAQMFGWNRAQIINAINVYETRQAKEKKMTREEALQKLYPFQWGTDKRKEFLDGLEALGLIKFGEAKSEKWLGDYLNKEVTIGLVQNGNYIKISGMLKGLVEN